MAALSLFISLLALAVSIWVALLRWREYGDKRRARIAVDPGEVSARSVSDRVFCTPRAEAAADGYGDGLDDAEREAVWLAAGIATFIGQAIADEPERFIVAAGDRCAV